MADVIFSEQTVEGFAPDESMGGAYSANVVGDFAALVVGQKYTVVWGVNKYTCTAQDVSAMTAAGGVAIGNLSALEAGEGNDEPFIIMYAPFDGGALYGFLAVDGSTDTSHTVAIYLAEEADVNYTIKGSTLTGIAEAIRSKTGGNDPIKVADMAAQIAAIVAGGSDKTPVLVKDSFEATAKSQTITHTLGVVPDVAILFMTNTTSSSGIAVACVGFSEALNNAIGSITNNVYLVTASGSMAMSAGVSIESTSTNANMYGAFHNVTAESFTVGGSSYGLLSGATYAYFLLGGLT